MLRLALSLRETIRHPGWAESRCPAQPSSSLGAMTAQRVSRILCFLLLAVGAGLCTHLLMRHWTVHGATLKTADFCGLVFGSSCDETLQSRWAVQLGLPLAGWGLVFYGTLASLLVLGHSIGPDFEFPAYLAALFLSLVATILGVVLLGVMLRSAADLCVLCVLVHMLNLALLLALKVSCGRTAGQPLPALARTFRFLFGAPARNVQRARWQVVGFLTAGLVGVVIYQWVLVEDTALTGSRGAGFDPQQTLRLYQKVARQEVLVDEQDGLRWRRFAGHSKCLV